MAGKNLLPLLCSILRTPSWFPLARREEPGCVLAKK
jgi:hypothetical protein